MQRRATSRGSSQSTTLTAMPLAAWRAAASASTLGSLWLGLGGLLCVAGFALDASGQGAPADRRLLAALLSGVLLGPSAGAVLCCIYLGTTISVDLLRGGQSLAAGAVGLPVAAFLVGWLAIRLRSERLLQVSLGCAAGAAAYGAVTWIWHAVLAWVSTGDQTVKAVSIGMLAVQAAAAVALLYGLAEYVRARGRARHE